MTTPSEELDPKDIELFDLRRENDRLRPALSAADNENARLREEVDRLRDQRDVLDRAGRKCSDERERLRKMEEPLRTLYRFVTDSWYARNFSVPSGVLERARQALEEGK